MLNSASMNEALRKHMDTHTTDAAARIDEHEAATGRVCPARMSVPGAAARVNALQLLAVTGGRFLSAFDGVPCAPGSDPPFKRQCTHSVSAAEAAAADALVAVIDGKAPDMLSAQQVVDLAEAAQLYSAGAVLEALPAYIEPLFSADGGLPLGEVATLLSGLTRTLPEAGDDVRHATLMSIYRTAWPRVLALLELRGTSEGGDDARTAQYVQLLLTGSVDGWCPPLRCLDFFAKAGLEGDMPPGLRCFFVMGAKLGEAAQNQRALDAASEVDVQGATAGPGAQGVAAHTAGNDGSSKLLPIRLRDDVAYDLLTMQGRLRVALCECLCRVQVQCTGEAARKAVIKLCGAVMTVGARLLSPAPPLVLASQRGKAHVLAAHDANRRAVVAVRLTLPSQGKASDFSTYAHGFGLLVQAKRAPAGTPIAQIATCIHVRGATDEQPKRVEATFGVMADSDATVRMAVAATEQWCHGQASRLSSLSKPLSSLWTTGPSVPMWVGNDGLGFWKCVTVERCKALGYKVVPGEDVIVFACCEWPAPGMPAPLL